MGRPKGSKNIPKIPPVVAEPAAPQILPKPRKKNKVEAPPKVAEVTKESGPLYVAFDMSNFIFTEHWLARTATRLHSEVSNDTSMRIIKDAQLAGEDVTQYTIKRILKAVGLNSSEIDKLLTQVKTHRENKPSTPQLYYKFNKRS